MFFFQGRFKWFLIRLHKVVQKWSMAQISSCDKELRTLQANVDGMF